MDDKGGICFLSLLYGGRGGVTKESLNDLLHRIFGNTKEYTKKKLTTNWNISNELNSNVKLSPV